METRANYVVVGVFTVLAVLAAFGFVYWTANLGTRGDVAVLQFRIQGSASGVMRGTSVVLFNGVKVGDINRVFLDFRQPGVAIAEALVDRRIPVTRSTRAEVGLAFLTSQANIELLGGDPDEPNLFDLAEASGGVATIDTAPSPVTNLLEGASDLFARADAVLLQLEGFAGDARGPLTRTLENVEQFSEALSSNSEGVGAFLESVAAMSSTLTNVSGQLESSLTAVERLIAAVDPEKVNETVGNVERFTRRLDEASGGLDDIMAGIGTTVESLSQFSSAANRTLEKIDGVVDGVDPASVRALIGNFEQASGRIGTAADEVATLVARINGRGEDIDAIISEARTLAGRLNGAAERVDGVLTRVDGLLGSEDAQAVIGEANQTLRSFRQTADTLNAHIDTITQELVGTPDQDGLIAEAGETLRSFREAADTLTTRVDGVLTRVDTWIGSEDAQTVMAEANRTLQSFRETADTLNARVDAISQELLGAGESGGVISEAGETIKAYRQVADTLNARMDGVFDKVDGLLGSDDAEGVMAEATETLRAFRQMADTLNARIGPITDGLSRFSGQGLRDVEALVQDGRRAINRIEQAITGLERNPQRILSGGAGSVREYDGRARR